MSIIRLQMILLNAMYNIGTNQSQNKEEKISKGEHCPKNAIPHNSYKRKKKRDGSRYPYSKTRARRHRQEVS